MNQILPNTIIAVNVAIRMGVIIIINKVRISTESVEMKYITNAVFLSIFFNTGLLIMLCNSNLEDQGLFGLGYIFNEGANSDFNTNWFTSQGDTIVKAMMANIYFPFVFECIYAMQRRTFRLIDYV